MKSVIIILAVLGFSAGTCTVGQHITKAGDREVVDFSYRLYAHEDTFLLRPFWPSKERIWRKDSFAIEEVRYIKITGDSKRDTTTFPIMHYRFTDLRKAAVYEFTSFSDTASLKRKFFHSDTVKVTGGWGFFLDRHMPDSINRTQLPDTMIGGKWYGRAFFSRRMSGIDYNYDSWFLTEKKATFFSLDQSTYQRTGIPMVGYHLYPQGNRGLKAVIEVTFIADTLSAEEEKVFAAWEKYAREHPVER